jgi:hypothetical protein
MRDLDRLLGRIAFQAVEPDSLAPEIASLMQRIQDLIQTIVFDAQPGVNPEQ